MAKLKERREAEARSKAERAKAEARSKAERAKEEAKHQRWAREATRGSVTRRPLDLGRAGLPEGEELDPPDRPSRSAAQRWYSLLGKR
ncbi:hypothetical protein [Reyranella sp.]|uniref:hypothetical protein n=1 Tax=Reyranella sp. TaxID=1929291 RepID=UPI0037842C49